VTLISNRVRTIYNVIAIAVGTLFFLLFLGLCFYRELAPDSSPQRPSPASAGPFLFAMGLGGCALIAGIVEGAGHLREDRGFAIALAVEGGLLIFLTLIAWLFMGPVPIPAE